MGAPVCTGPDGPVTTIWAPIASADSSKTRTTTSGVRGTVSPSSGVEDRSVLWADAKGAQIVVTGPSGPVQTGAPTVSGQSVRQALAADSPAGNYSITWRVTSEDGHPVTGTLHFTAQAAGGGQAPQESAPPAATNNSGGASVQTKLVLIAALVAAAGIGALLWRSLRRKRSAAT